MATPLVNTQQLHEDTLTLRPEERQRLEKRRQYVRDYEPPKWKSSQPDPVSGQLIERPMVPHASILHLQASRAIKTDGKVLNFSFSLQILSL